jgi:hypothetical protein
MNSYTGIKRNGDAVEPALDDASVGVDGLRGGGDEGGEEEGDEDLGLHDCGCCCLGVSNGD